MNPPTNVSDFRSFLGMTGYYRNFIKNYSSKATPLCLLLKKNATFEWSHIQNNSFQLLKNCLISALILCYPKYNIPFIIRSDVCGYGIRLLFNIKIK